jgi:hypothetical protein
MTLPAQWKKGPRPDPSVVELLDSLQEAARKGLIRAVAVVAVNPLLEVETTHAGDMDNVKSHLLCGGLVEAAHKITKIQK